jgi:hypothetical protein
MFPRQTGQAECRWQLDIARPVVLPNLFERE